jgi:hypothetical protein
MLKILVVDGFHTDRIFPIRLRLNLSRAVEVGQSVLEIHGEMVMIARIDETGGTPRPSS